jgi:hypothetical protein
MAIVLESEINLLGYFISEKAIYKAYILHALRHIVRLTTTSTINYELLS